MRRLIVNADDFGRTAGIVAGTLDAHRDGIVTSATVMVLEPAAAEGIRRALSEAPELDLGLHFVATGGGAPASAPETLPTLAPGGRFVRDARALPPAFDPEEAARELAAQIARFEDLAGRPPSHLDSHHHCALHPSIAPAFAEAALRLGIPARASSPAAREFLRARGVRTPDRFVDSFYGEVATLENLLAILESLPEGATELMCHPGYPDEELLATSTYARDRGSKCSAILRLPRSWIASASSWCRFRRSNRQRRELSSFDPEHDDCRDREAGALLHEPQSMLQIPHQTGHALAGSGGSAGRTTETERSRSRRRATPTASGGPRRIPGSSSSGCTRNSPRPP